MPTEYIIIPLCREVLVAYSVLFLLNIGAVSDKTVCETIHMYTQQNLSKFAQSAQNVQFEIHASGMS